jgi:putative hemolysin
MRKMILVTVSLVSLSAFAGGGSSVGPENPAARNCLALGGAVEIVEDPDGNQASYCAIAQWTLFREMAARGLTDDSVQGNPASLNCLKAGGTLRRVVTPEGEDHDCVIEAWTLFRIIDVVGAP